MILLLVLACKDPKPSGPPTDTFPSFYGSVPKNLLVISMDTFRRDQLSRFGSDETWLPALEKMQNEGVALDQHRSCSNWTMPSIFCATTGASNLDAGFVPDLRVPDSSAPTVPTLASRLQDAGYETVLVTSNSWFSPDHNTAAGFDYALSPDNRSASSIFDTGITQISEFDKDTPWYLHMHVKEPHPPYTPPDAYLKDLNDLPAPPEDWDFTSQKGQYAVDGQWEDMTPDQQQLALQYLWIRYHGELRYLDDQLEDAFKEMDANGMLDDTLVMFWTDHGEQMFEHGHQSHAYDMHAEENNSVAFFWAKNIVTDSWDEPTTHADLPATVLSLFGVPLDDKVTGYPVGTAPSDRVISTVSLARLGPTQAVIGQGHKMIYYWNSGTKTLFDLENDPGELNNLYTPEDPVVVSLWETLSPLVTRLQELSPRDTPVNPGP